MSTRIGQHAPAKEIRAWAMFDFANSGYTTVVLTAIYNTFFVSVIASDLDSGSATFLWTLTISIANGLVLLSAPVLGAITDISASKKYFLLLATIGCVVSTAALAIPGPGDITLAIFLVIISSFLFFTGENLISAFLPELVGPERSARVSAFGWTIGYAGGLITLTACLAYIQWAETTGQSAEQFVPATMVIVAIIFALASIPTFIWLKERKVAQAHPPGALTYIRSGMLRLKDTWQHARTYRDLFRFLVCLTVYHCGINTVVVLAAVYAQQVMGFSTQDSIMLIMVVNLSAAAGAWVFGQIQDRAGARNTLLITLLIWTGATLGAYFVDSRAEFWIIANLVGLALGASQSGGRALVATFSPASRSGEFFGLWGLATKLSTIIGPMSYGVISWLTQGDHRTALLSTVFFFVLGIALLFTVNETRGRQAAAEQP